MKKMTLIAIVMSSMFMLQGCVAALIGAGAGTTVKVATDPRTAGKQVDDTTLDSRISMKFRENSNDFIGSRIIATSYNGSVLLTGQANSEQSAKAESLAGEIEGINKIFNQIRSGDPVGPTTITNDAWITTKVKSQLVANADTKARNIKVVTENSEVFLMGIVTAEDGKAAAEVASKVYGVQRVTTVFNYINQD